MLLDRLQVKAARALLEIGVRELGEESGVNYNTISRFENGGSASIRTREALRETLELLGVQFVGDEHTEDVGVVLQRAELEDDE